MPQDRSNRAGAPLAKLAAGGLALSLGAGLWPLGADAACLDELTDGTPVVRWSGTTDGEERLQLDAWCAAVGPPVLTAPPSTGAIGEATESLAIVSWNVNGGRAELARLVADLRSGALTEGRPVRHFVLLLQEAVRTGEEVPAEPPPGALSARRISSSSGPRSIHELAAAEELFLFYVPAMRNGAEEREDRGNAILSTLPLSDPMILELPHERQRRVAAGVRVEGRDTEGRPFGLRLVSVHLENRSRWGAWRRSFGAARARQAEWLLDQLDGEDLVLGGDFNTWFRESEEPAIALLRERLKLPGVLPSGSTYAPPFSRRLDYLMFRLPSGWEANYRPLTDRRGSDHAPLLGWVRTNGTGNL